MAETFSIIIGVTFLIVVPVLLLSWWDRIRDRKRILYIQPDRVDRMPLSDQEFCLKEGLDSSQSNLVATVRSKVGKLSCHDPLYIYPDDSFSDLGISYGEVEMLMDNMDVEFEWEPSYVGEFVLEVVRLRKERAT